MSSTTRLSLTATPTASIATETLTESHPANGLIRYTQKSQPSYKAGYAKSASESAYPELWDGMVGAWAPNLGITGDSLRDVSGNGNHGTFTNMDAATDWVQSEKGWALDFDATEGEYISLPNAVLKAGRPYSICWWEKVTADTGDWPSRIILDIEGSASCYLVLRPGGHENYRYLHWGRTNQTAGGHRSQDVSAPASVTGQWKFFCITDTDPLNKYADGDSRVFEDGQEKTASQGYTLYGITGNRIGYDGADHGPNCKFGPVFVFNRRISAGDVQTLHRDPLAPFRQRKSIPFGVTSEPTESHPANGLIRYTQKSQPSYKAGYAKSASESAYPNLWDGLVGAWAPNLGITGDSLRDVSGKGSHATGDQLELDSDWGMTEVGPALTLNGNSYDGMLTNVNANDLLGGTSYLSMSVWVKVNATHQGMVLCGTNGGGNRFYIETFTNGTLHWGLGGVQNYPTSQAYYTLGKWHHYLISREGGAVKAYLDGVNVDTTTGVIGTYTSNPIGIGYYDTGLGFDGDIALCQIWNRPLQADEVAEMASDPMGMFRQRRSIPFGVTEAPETPEAILRSAFAQFVF